MEWAVGDKSLLPVMFPTPLACPAPSLLGAWRSKLGRPEWVGQVRTVGVSPELARLAATPGLPHLLPLQRQQNSETVADPDMTVMWVGSLRSSPKMRRCGQGSAGGMVM